MTTQPLPTRRALLRGAAAAGLIATAAPSLVACSNDNASSASSGKAGKALPSYVPIKTDLAPTRPGNTDGLVMPYFDNYPQNPVSLLKGQVGDGKPTSAFMITYSALPPAKKQNAYWQYMNQQLNTDLDLNIITGADYATKIAALVAGGHLPDIVQVQTATANLQRLPALAQAKFVDLGQYLSGDAVKEYPYLANIPTDTWKASIWGGHLYGVPTTRSLFQTVNFKNAGVLEQAGVTSDPTNLDDFLTVCKQVTNPAKGVYALGGETGVGQSVAFSMFLQAFGVPNAWSEDSGGNLTAAMKTEQWFSAVDYAKKLWDAGVYHPDTPSMTNAAKQTAFEGNRLAFIDDSLAYWNTALKRTPAMRLDMRTPFGAGGAKPVHWMGLGQYGTSCIRKGNEDRVPALLSMLNFLAAPFGTKEFLAKEYGAAGVTHSLDAKGNPVLTKSGTLDVTCYINRLSNGPIVLYDTAIKADDMIRQQDAQKKLAEIIVPNPAAGYDTAVTTTPGRGAALQNVYDNQVGYIIGRKSKSDLQAAVDDFWNKFGKDEAKQIADAKAGDR